MTRENFWFLIGKIIDGLKQPFNIMGFEISFFSLMLWLALFTLLLNFVNAVLGGDSYESSHPKKGK